MPFSNERQDLPRNTARVMHGLGLIVLLLAPLALGGCSMFSSKEDEAMAAITAAAPKPCPTVGVLAGADQITVFNGAGHELSDVVLKATIDKAAISCEYDVDDNTISVDIAFNGSAEMGPAATDSEMNLKGFMAVTHVDDKQISKVTYDIPLNFDKGTRQIRFLKSIEDTVVPYGGAVVNGSVYEMLVGFQVTQQQLDYNRKMSSESSK